MFIVYKKVESLTEVIKKIGEKILKGERLTKKDGLALYDCDDLAWLGSMADLVRQRISGDYVYYNVNRHINLTNICTSRCSFCAFGCDEDSQQAYEMNQERVLEVVKQATADPDLSGLHIVSGLHPTWPFEYYVNIIRAIKTNFPTLHLKGFTGVEITHFAKISGKSIRQVLQILMDAGLEALPGGGAEILSDRIRQQLCPNKASASEWLEVAETAHDLGLKTNASMLYGHIETIEERIDHLLTLRKLQDKTGGFQTFICFPFHPEHTEMAKLVQRTSVWDDLKTMAISRLMLDNFRNIKAYWVMLTLPIAQLALGFGANDIDGTIQEEKIMHAAGAKSSKSLSKEILIATIKEAGRTPVECDCNFNIVKVF